MMNRIPASGEQQGPRRAVMPLVPKPPKQSVAGRVFGKMISQKQVKNIAVNVVLKAAWASYGPVSMIDLEDEIMAFDFQNTTDRDRILDMSPWAIHGNCLNLKMAPLNRSSAEIDFGRISIWCQVHGLSPEMLNVENARAIASSIGSCLGMDKEDDMQTRGYLRLQIDIDVGTPLMPGFWWTNESGQDKWATIRYERLSDFCFGCGSLGHSALVCNKEIVSSELYPGKPMYGPWTACDRQRKQGARYQIGGSQRAETQKRELGRRSWKEMLQEFEKGGASRDLGEVQPKVEPGHTGPVSAPFPIQGAAQDLQTNFGGDPGSQDPPLSETMVTHDLSLSLQPLRPSSGLLDLNEIPREDDSDLGEELQASSFMHMDLTNPLNPTKNTQAVGSLKQEFPLPLVICGGGGEL